MLYCQSASASCMCSRLVTAMAVLLIVVLYLHVNSLNTRTIIANWVTPSNDLVVLCFSTDRVRSTGHTSARSIRNRNGHVGKIRRTWERTANKEVMPLIHSLAIRHRSNKQLALISICHVVASYITSIRLVLRAISPNCAVCKSLRCRMSSAKYQTIAQWHNYSS